MTIRIVQSDTDIRQCLPAMLALRSQLTDEQAFAQIRLQQRTDGYVLAFVEPDNSAQPSVAVMGYRILHFLHSGKTLYIDDLSTLSEARGKGFAGALLDFATEQARQAGCQCVSLDSGQNPARYDAHRLYLKKGFNITSHHFQLSL